MVRKGGGNRGKRKQNGGSGRKIKGRGDYKTFNLRGMAQSLDRVLSKIPKGTFARKGAQMGAKYGALGALAGRGLGAGLAAVTGYGNYTVRSNTLSKVSTSVDMIPQFVKNDHSVRVTHREFIKDLVVPNDPSAFNLQSYLINPANSVLFPWLATLARQYSQYKIHGMVFAYKTMSSDITAGGALGTVIMATNYNAIDRAFLNKIEMENSEFAVSTKPSMSLIHAIECDPKYSGLDVLYVRDPSYETSDTNDRRFYDYGRFQLATTGLPGSTGTTMGELWVSYDIEFMKPVIGGAGVPLYTLGKCIVSRTDGSVGVGYSPSSAEPRSCTVIWEGQPIVPLANTSYPLIPSSPVLDGDVAIVPTVVQIDPNTPSRFFLRKNGTYVCTFSGSGPTDASKYALASISLQPILLTALNVGSAVSTVTDVGGVHVPHICSTATATIGLSYSIQYQVVVTGITDNTGYVRITPSNFTTHTGFMIANWERDFAVEWTSFGENSQDPSFNPVID